MLKVRLEYLGERVDKFIVIESSIDFSGKPKGLVLTKSVVESLPYSWKVMVFVWRPNIILGKLIFPLAGKHGWRKTLWKIQKFQRNHLVNALRYSRPEDVVLFGDLDEIPDRESLTARAVEPFENKGEIGVFRQKLFYYSLQVLVDMDWRGTVICSVATVLKMSPKQIRRQRNKADVFSGGWHFSYFGSPSAIQQKISAIASVEGMDHAIKLNEDDILDKINSGKDLYGHPYINPELVKSPEIPPELLALIIEYFPENSPAKTPNKSTHISKQ